MLITHDARLTAAFERISEREGVASKVLRAVGAKSAPEVAGVSLKGARELLYQHPPKMVESWFAESMRVTERAPFPGGGLSRPTGQLLKKNEFMELLCRAAASKVVGGSLARPFGALMSEINGEKRHPEADASAWSRKKPVAD